MAGWIGGISVGNADAKTKVVLAPWAEARALVESVVGWDEGVVMADAREVGNVLDWEEGEVMDDACGVEVLVLAGCKEELVGLNDGETAPEEVLTVTVTVEGLVIGFALLAEAAELLVATTVAGV